MASKTKKITNVVDQWHVRDENGVIFGPVGFRALKSWVEDGRVSPASEVSSSDDQWELAVRVAELEMNCVAEIQPATFYGPIHRKAMQGLIESGSIPAEAYIYCKQGVQEQSAPVAAKAVVSQAKYDAAMAQLASLKAEKDANEAELHRASEELAELTTSQSESDATLNAKRAEIAALNRSILDLQLKVETFSSEREGFSAEIEALSRDSQYQKEQAKQREQLYQAELSEKDSAYALQISALKREYECEMNAKDSACALQISALNREYEREMNAKDSACALQISVLTREREREAEAMAAKNLQLAGLLQRLEELELANQGLKDEFIKHEELQSSGRSDAGAAGRKLVLLKGLFAEAARLLEGVEADSEQAVAEIQETTYAGGAEGELLEYEEISIEELKIQRDVPGFGPGHTTENRGQPTASRAYKEQPAPEQNVKPNKPKTGKKWLFGGAEERVGNGSLAELEARAQIELQRLASSQDISSLFDRKK